MRRTLEHDATVADLAAMVTATDMIVIRNTDTGRESYPTAFVHETHEDGTSTLYVHMDEG